MPRCHGGASQPERVGAPWGFLAASPTHPFVGRRCLPRCPGPLRPVLNSSGRALRIGRFHLQGDRRAGCRAVRPRPMSRRSARLPGTMRFSSGHHQGLRFHQEAGGWRCASAGLQAPANGLEPSLRHCKELGGVPGRKRSVKPEDPAIRTVPAGAPYRESGAEATAFGRVCRGRNDVLAHGNGVVQNLVRSVGGPGCGLKQRGAAWVDRRTRRSRNAREERLHTLRASV